MDRWLDNLAKDSAHRLSRRQIFGRLAGGFGIAVLGVFGLTRRVRADNSCVAKECEVCCTKDNPAKGGFPVDECIRLCHEGQDAGQERCGSLAFSICGVSADH